MPTPPATPTPAQLKALTHPVRVRMLALLRVDGPATATTLAARLGLNTGATSYHLRQLAQHGFIVDDEGRGNGRDRWWRAAHQTTAAGPASPDVDGDTLDAFLQTVASGHAERLQEAMEERPLLPAAWRDASEVSDWAIRLTPARARALLDTVVAVLEEATDDPSEDAEDAEVVVVQLHGFPLPGRVGGAS